MKKTLIFAVIILSLFVLAPAVMAQDDAQTISTAITAEDLGVSEPTVLPDNVLGYFFKNLGRSIQLLFTFDAEKRTELQLKFANERLLEADKLAEVSPDDEKIQELVVKAQEKYQELMERVNSKIEGLEVDGQTESAAALLERVTSQQINQQQLMEQIQNRLQNLNQEQEQRLLRVRNQVLENFGDALEVIEDNDNAGQVLQRLRNEIHRDDAQEIFDQIQERREEAVQQRSKEQDKGSNRHGADDSDDSEDD